MTILHTLRRVALQAGLDIQRACDTSEARICRLLRGRSVSYVLDVGANRGQYGRQLRQFGYSGHIHSFEPLPDVYQELTRTASRDPSWTTSQCALGPQDGTASLNIASNEAAASSSVLPLLPRHKAAAPDVKYVGIAEIPMRRLDTIWDEIVPADVVPFLKVDVQGFEGQVLDGARDSLSRVIGLQLEISLLPLYEGGLSIREVLDRTDKLGMQLVFVKEGFVDSRTGELLQVDGVFLRPGGSTSHDLADNPTV